MMPFPYKTLSHSQIELDNIIFGTYRPITFELAGQTFTLCFSQSLPNYQAHYGFKVRQGDTTLGVGLNSLPSLGSLDSELANISLENLPKGMGAVVLETVLDEVLKSAEQGLKTQLSIESIQLEPPVFEFEHQIYFNIQNGQQSISGHLDLNKASYQQVANAIKNVPQKKRKEFPSLSVRSSISTGSTLLSNSELKKLELNDIILIDDNNFIEHQTLFLILSSTHKLKARYDNGKIITI